LIVRAKLDSIFGEFSFVSWTAGTGGVAVVATVSIFGFLISFLAGVVA